MAGVAARGSVCPEARPPARPARGRRLDAMKLLVATARTQGRRPNDFCWAEEGEIVTFGSECGDEPVDGPCGCRRALRGVVTRKAATTFLVVQRPDLRLRDLARMVAAALVAGGWYPSLDRAHAAAVEDAQRLAEVALGHAEGTILERRGGTFSARAATSPSPSRSRGVPAPRARPGAARPA